MSRTLSAALDAANPNNLPDAMRLLPAGKALGLLPRTVRVAVVANVAVLPEGAKAAAVLDVFVSAGGVDGQFTVVAPNATPLTTECAINEDGDVLFLGADAVTEAEITYVAAEGDVFTDTMTVTAGAGSFSSGRHGRVILSAFNTTSGSPVALTVIARGGAAGVGQVNINTAGDGCVFNVAVTSATVTYVAFPSEPVGEQLASSVDF